MKIIILVAGIIFSLCASAESVTQWHGEGGIISLKNNKLYTPWGHTYFPEKKYKNDASWVAFKWHGPGGVIYLNTDGNLLRSWAGGYYFPYVSKDNSSSNRGVYQRHGNTIQQTGGYPVDSDGYAIMENPGNEAYMDNDPNYKPEKWVPGTEYEPIEARKSSPSSGSSKSTTSVGPSTRNWKKFAQGGFGR